MCVCVCLYWVYVCLYVCARLAQFKDLWLPTGAGFIAWPGWGLNFGWPSFSTPSLDRDVKRSHTLVDKSRLTESGRGGGGSWSCIPLSYFIGIPHPVSNFGKSCFPGAVTSWILHPFLVKSWILWIPFETLGQCWCCSLSLPPCTLLLLV